MSDKLDLQSPDLVNQNIQKIAALFPNCITETAEGKAIDFDLLKQELNPNIVEGSKERYRLEWPGKREAIVTANLPTTKTLRPVPEESVNFDTTENLYIEGDNLEVLKLLQESYLGKIKMIYIDPPYNTGSDFVYKDNFTQDSEEFKFDDAQKDEVGRRLVVNPETSGRYHSDWLTMMYPRLKLARNLLKDDGVIFISIDDNEIHNLRKNCDEIFGEHNFISIICWQKFHSVKSNANHNISKSHDFILCYGKNIDDLSFTKLPMSKEALEVYKNPDNDPRGIWRTAPLTVSLLSGSRGESYKRTGKSTGLYTIVSPNGKEHKPSTGRCWIAEDSVERLRNDNRIWWGKDGNAVPMQKIFLLEKGGVKTISTFWDHSEYGSNKKANEELKVLFSDNDNDTENFPTPKPTILISTLINIADERDGLYLDFFSGSATTADSIMQLNAKDGGTRKYIMVQLPELISSGKYKSIAEIGKERIRRAGKKIADELNAKIEKQKAEQAGKLDFDKDENSLLQEDYKLDIGFRVYRLDSSNMQDVYYRPQDYKPEMMDMFTDNIKPDRTPRDLLAQVMLDWGLPLSYRIEEMQIDGKQVFRVAQNSLMACFDNGINEDFAKELATYKPLRVVFRDRSFANDTAKENVKQLLKQLSPETEMRVI